MTKRPPAKKKAPIRRPPTRRVKKKAPQDATMRNVRATAAQLERLEARLDDAQQATRDAILRLNGLEVRVTALEGVVDTGLAQPSDEDRGHV